MCNKSNGIQATKLVLALKSAGYGLLFIILFFLGQFVGVVLMDLLYPALATMNEDMAETAFMYGAYLGCGLLIVVGLLLIKPLRPILATVARKPQGNNFRLSIFGLLLGFGLSSLCVGIAILHGDIQLLLARFDLMPILILLIAVFIQCTAEELLCRAVLYRLTARVTDKPCVLVISNSLIFALLHSFTPGVTILSLTAITLFGILMSVMVYCWDSLWAAIACHTAWNFSLSIVWGLPNSGQALPYHIMGLARDSAKDSLFYNVGFGIEGTAFAVLLLVLVIMIIGLRGQGAIKRSSSQE